MISGLWSRVLGQEAAVADGRLTAKDRSWPVTGGIVRFREGDDYNSTFASQWKTFKLNQYDDHNGTHLTRRRYLKETGWPDSGLDGELILEAGCGAGRFTRILGATGADLVCFDYSTAVEVSAEQNGRFANVTFAQADILDLPFQPGCFDRVFCHGVLQHTPDPEKAFHALAKLVRPGGRLSIDIYHRDGKIRPWKSKYLWRWLTTRMDPDRLMAVLRWYIPRWLPLDTTIKRIPYLANYLGAVIPCWNYHFTNLPKSQLVEWAVMDTFDALAPVYDLPATMPEVKSWFASAGFTEVEVREGGTGLVGNGVKT